jgi:electron transfer flavoprotein alpha subunit
METILYLAPVETDGTLSKASLEAAGAAKALAQALGGAKLLAGLFGADASKAAAQLGGAGFEKALLAEDAALSQPRYATDAAAFVALAQASGASIVVAPASSRVQRVAAGAASRLKGAIDTHATELLAENGAAAATRWLYRQRFSSTVRRAARPWILTVDAGNYPAPSGGAAPAAEKIAFTAPATGTVVEGVRSPSSGPQTIRPDAQILFVAGAGWCKKQADGTTHVPEAEKLILGFLDKAKASLGGSKSMVDQQGEGAALSFMSHLNQIGQTGATPRHPKGLATCCHGEEPHVVGWRFVNERRAVNLNAGCGWAQGKADVLYVADAFQVVARVNELLG